VSDEPKNEDRQVTDTHWHLRKELNLGHLLTTLALATGMFTWGMGMDSRVTATEVRVESLTGALSEHRVEARELRQELLIELRTIRSQLDVIRTTQAQRGPRRDHENDL
jgi:hypothetical protein